MPKPRRKPHIELDDTARGRWERALDKVHFFQTTSPLPIFRVDPVLAAWIAALAGPDLESFREAVHKTLDRHLLNHQERNNRWIGGTTKITPFGVEVKGLPLRLRLNDIRGMVVDIMGDGGMLCEGDITLDSVLPDSVLRSAVGRRADQVMANLNAMFDGSRTIVSAHVRFKRSTVLRLSPVTQVGVTYAELFGSPRRRFTPLPMPTLTAPG